MYVQTLHEHPISGGYTWRMPPGQEGTMKALQELVWPEAENDIIARPVGDEALALLNRYDIRYVMLVKGPWLDERPDAGQRCRQLLGEPIFSDSRQEVYRVPISDTDVNIDAFAGPLALDDHWHSVELGAGSPARWLAADGAIFIHCLTPGKWLLSGRALSLDGATPLQILVNGDLVAEFEVHSDAAFQTGEFSLSQGQNSIQFVVPSGCRPANEVNPALQDGRCLSIRVSDLALTAQAE